ncbi:MAG: hypothetical protein ABJK28_18275 [Algibacter sp.]
MTIRNNILIIMVLLICSYSGKKEKQKIALDNEIAEEPKAELTDFTTMEIDSLFDNEILTKKLYPNMSACGGGLFGFYHNNELKLIDSKYQAELGYSSKKIYWNGNKILKIKHQEYFAEWGKYEKKYPPEKIEYDPSKMTYSDTIYEITFGDEYEFKKIADNKLISTKTDSTLIDKLIDCGKRMKLELESITKIKLESELDNDYSKSAELFAKEVLSDNIRTHTFDLDNSENPKHLRIFQSDGIEKVIAYSNKNYPKNSEPNYYEHFILFVATFNNKENAKKTFKRIKSDSKYGLSEWNKLEKGLSERVRSLNIGAKPGGMITQRGKQILSLVKTCRETPISGNWKDYENKYIGFITKNGEEIEVLNSDCGMDRYKIKKRKASR